MDQISNIFKPKVRADIIVKNLHDEKVLFNPLNSMIYVLNKTAFPIWQLSNGINTVDVIVCKLSNIFEKPDENYNIKQDVLNTLSEFKNQGLLE